MIAPSSCFHIFSVSSVDEAFMICVMFEDVQEIDRSSASYSSGVAGSATKGLIVVTKASNLFDFGKKSWKDEEVSQSITPHVNNKVVRHAWESLPRTRTLLMDFGSTAAPSSSSIGPRNAA